MQLSLPYGNGSLDVFLPDALDVDIFEPKTAPCLADPVAALQGALDVPLGCPPLEGRTAPASVAIAVPDETRPFPVKMLLPPLLERLFSAYPTLTGEKICIVVGGGLHPAADAEQLARILPLDMYGCRVISHDAKRSALACFGRTSRGTPVEINAEYGNSELKIVMGLVDAHQFVGFTGGAKGVVVGCASAAMIAVNHRMMCEATAVAGNIENNPVRLDLDEAGRLAGVHLAINVVLDATKHPVALLAGLPDLAMREGARMASEMYGLCFTRPYDIVLASCGGEPKDICLYQAQKGLNSAMQCAATGARILLTAKCAQGIGDAVYSRYVRKFKDAHSLQCAFEQEGFAMGAHKAYLFARATNRFTVVIHSELPEETLAECHLAAENLQSAVDRWLTEIPDARIAVITNANSSFFLQENKA